MIIKSPILLRDVEAFLSESRMSESYFGKAACGNSEVVSRLRDGGRVWPETETKIRSFMLLRRNAAKARRLSAKADNQGKGATKVNDRSGAAA